MTKQIITRKGAEKLSNKLSMLLQKLKEVQAEKAHAYNASGDGWHDNPGWLQLGQAEEQLSKDIQQLNRLLSMATIVDTANKAQAAQVQIGSVVEFTVHMPNGKLVPWRVEIGGTGESNIREKMISYDSPIGQAIMGAKVNDHVNVILPVGNCSITINAVR